MKHLIFFAIGVGITVLLTNYPRWLPGLLSRGDSDRLPIDYPGPRFRTWTNGVENKS